MVFPDFKFEEPLWESGHTVIGIDEVGRGAFAGPVGVGGVMFPNKLNSKEKEHLISLGINDSKKLSPKKRKEFSEILKQLCIYKIVLIDVPTINEIGIGKAIFLGMQRVAECLSSRITGSRVPPFGEAGLPGMTGGGVCILVDGFEIPGLRTQQKGIVRGDSLSISIAAASILAKVERDRLMESLSLQTTNYGFERNKGYGTLFHRNAIKEFGSTPHHRTDFISAYI